MIFKARQPIYPPQLPDGVRVYAISDIHGRADLLQKLFTIIDRNLAALQNKRPIHVFLGDYIDRGPASRETIELLIDRHRKYECIFLKGNHEALLFEVLKNPSRLADWRQYGGLPTLTSYGLRPSLNPSEAEQRDLIAELSNKIPVHHRRFFNNLRTHFVCGDFFFVHAGIRPGIPLDRQTEEDMLWIRDEFLESGDDFEKYVVHGHTPVAVPDIRPNRINIDTGAYATGKLTLLTIQDDILVAL